MTTADAEVRAVLEEWAAATRLSRTDEILKHHSTNLVIFDVLPPMKYESADVAFAHSFIRCGGTFPDGRTFQDLVRATFCLRKVDGSWMVEHQHVSKPYVHS
jgi:ketosteroid isomerase-like protein